MSIRPWLFNVLTPKTAASHTADIVRKNDCVTALDIGCGSSSHLSKFRPKLQTAAIDVSETAIFESKRRNLHDFYIKADVLKDDISTVLKHFDGRKFDLITLYGVIEHFPKALGLQLLDKCEQLTSKYILLETPNGYVPQGPEFGNEFQRHLSGWFEHDFRGRGYDVYGTTGTSLFLGYGSAAKFRVFGSDIPCLMCDILATWLLRVDKWPKYSFNLVAIKDVRGVPARGNGHLANSKLLQTASSA